jgi:NAD(P)-dependent dehydrogenase (short-subunit alcohol dehydrogenase family)
MVGHAQEFALVCALEINQTKVDFNSGRMPAQAGRLHNLQGDAMDVRLDGRVALVTGGSRGLGLAIARKFAESGADVAITSRSEDKLAEAKAAITPGAQGKVLALASDVTRPDQIQQLVAKVTAELGKIDILVNNAGSSLRGNFEELTDDQWQADMDLKLFAAIRLARAVIPGMKARKWGRMINVVSIGGKAPPGASAPTTVTRAAGIALTKVLSQEFAQYNILVNALCVGWIKSDQWIRNHRRESPDREFQDYLRMKGKGVPLGRMGEAEEFANLACFLASEAGGYITGTAINVDGGKSPVV